MKLPVIEGVIRRRILVNFRVRPEAIQPWIPDRFQITTVQGYAMAGICLIQLEGMRPKSIGVRTGVASDNVAYRVAVHWESGGRIRNGVYIPRRDTSSTLQHVLGGRIFPGEYHHSLFETSDKDGAVTISCRSDDGHGDVRLLAHETDGFAPDSVFGSLRNASEFFEHGSIGYSATKDADRLDGLVLQSKTWSVAPLAIEWVESSFFDDPDRFPPGSVAFDNALIMRNIAHEWHALPAVSPACSRLLGESIPR